MTDDKGVSTVYTNLLARSSLINNVLSNPLLFYSYDIQDGETPEIIADKYYGDSYRYWMILLANNILDPQWDWPLSSTNFNKYIADKYTSVDPYTTIHHYEKIVTQYDSASLTTTVNKFIIDDITYNELVGSSNTYSFPTSTTTITVSKNAVTLFEYEVETNEAKRNIKLLRKDLATQIETELKNLMA